MPNNETFTVVDDPFVTTLTESTENLPGGGVRETTEITTTARGDTIERQRAIYERNPTLAYQQVKNLNDVLAFAENILVFGQNIHDVKKAIEGISLEIAEMGLEINSIKCCLMSKDLNMNDV